MKRIRYRPGALRDLEEIGRFSIDTFGLTKAKVYVGRIEKVVFDVAAGRRRGRPADALGRGLMKISAGSHFVFFREAENEITVVRVLHSRMNLPDHL